MSDYGLSAAARRRWEMWRQFHPKAGPPMRKLDGHEIVSWKITRELSLALLEAFATQTHATPKIQGDLKAFQSAVQHRQYHDFFVTFWLHKKGLFGREIWIAKPELWTDHQEFGGPDTLIFALGYIAAPNERELARRLKQLTDLDGTARLFENGWEAISAMRRW